MESLNREDIIRFLEKNEILKDLRETIQGTLYQDRVFVVGGFVRDYLLGNSNNDIDLLIDGDISAGIYFANWFCKKKGIYHQDYNPVVYGLYGTAMIHLNKQKIETVAPRSEKYYDGSRNPDVSSSTLEEDAFRRDFTINSLFINISNGEIKDFTDNGINDLRNGVIRSCSNPDIIFSDDPLRMMRAIRFQSRFGYEIEESTWFGIKKNVDKISIISQERISEEFSKILVSKYAVQGLELLRYSGLMERIIPEFKATYDCFQNVYHNYNSVWNHTMLVVENSKPILENRLAALFHDIAKPKLRTVEEDGKVHFYTHELESSFMVREILRRMKFPNEIIDKVSIAVENHMRLKGFDDRLTGLKDKVLRKLQYDLGDNLDLTLDLIDADNKSIYGPFRKENQIQLVRERLKAIKEKGEDCSNIKLPINGKDIMEHYNIEQSPIIGDIIIFLKKKYIGNPRDISSKEDCFKLIDGEFNLN